jgi:hypothetical protein
VTGSPHVGHWIWSTGREDSPSFPQYSHTHSMANLRTHCALKAPRAQKTGGQAAAGTTSVGTSCLRALISRAATTSAAAISTAAQKNDTW